MFPIYNIQDTEHFIILDLFFVVILHFSIINILKRTEIAFYKFVIFFSQTLLRILTNHPRWKSFSRLKGPPMLYAIMPAPCTVVDSLLLTRWPWTSAEERCQPMNTRNTGQDYKHKVTEFSHLLQKSRSQFFQTMIFIILCFKW